MPLDIQPLSPGRRAAMLLVLLGLFGASLGFAQWLVISRGAAVPKFYVSFTAPPGMTDEAPAYAALEGAVLTGSGEVDGNPRQFAAFSYEGTTFPDNDTTQEEAKGLYERVGRIRKEQDVNVKASPGILGRRPAIDLEGVIGTGEDERFLLLRLAQVPGRVVAICYSGPGSFTDADKSAFEAFCMMGVTITQAAAPSDQDNGK